MNKPMAIDLSLRSTGVSIIIGDKVFFKLILTSKDKMSDEETLLYIWEEIWSFIETHKPTHIAIEDLSYDSISSSKDFIAGNFWFVRTHLHKFFPTIPVDIISVAEWRNPMFNKEERKTLTENKKALKALKVVLKALPKAEKSTMVLENEQLILDCDIKHLTYNKHPEHIKAIIESAVTNKSRFDLSDAYGICAYYKTKLEKESV
jgi:hypothetical protein